MERGADVDAVCWDKTPLMLACLNQHAELVEELISLGADPMLRDGERRMAVDHCKHPATAEFLWGLMEGKFLLRCRAGLRAAGARGAARLRVATRVLADALEILGCAGALTLRPRARRAPPRPEYRPDKRPHGRRAGAGGAREWTSRFHAVQDYEAVGARRGARGPAGICCTCLPGMLMGGL